MSNYNPFAPSEFVYLNHSRRRVNASQHQNPIWSHAMKNVICVCGGILMLSTALVAAQMPTAQVHLHITSELPIFPECYCGGNLTVTNNGAIPFVIVVDPNYVGGVVYLYRDYEGTRQQVEDEHRGGAQRKKDVHQEVVSYYEYCLKANRKTLRLSPGEWTTVHINKLYFEGLGDIYTAELYLGNGVWAPVNISPSIGYLVRIARNSPDKDSLYYAKKWKSIMVYCYFCLP
jgi:hypothetical protein